MNTGLHELSSKQPMHYTRCHISSKAWGSAADILTDETFDAEKLLEDLGFAGSSDPTIPERFLPSLLHRLSTMPRTALWYMNHRILQTLILHKRKEQRRKLFRHASVNNKEVLESRSHVLNLLLNHTSESNTAKENGLVRAFTGPTDACEEIVISACQSTRKSPASTLTSGNTFDTNVTRKCPAGTLSLDNAFDTNVIDHHPLCPIKICIKTPSEEENVVFNKVPESEIDRDGSVLPSSNEMKAEFRIGKDDVNDSKSAIEEDEIESREMASSVPELMKRINLSKINVRKEIMNEKIKSYSEEDYMFPEMEPHSRTSITRSFSKFSKDQRRMVLKRSSAVLRPRSASEPLLVKYPVKFDSFMQDDGLFDEMQNDTNDNESETETTMQENGNSGVIFENRLLSLNSTLAPNLSLKEPRVQTVCYIKFWPPSLESNSLCIVDTSCHYIFNNQSSSPCLETNAIQRHYLTSINTTLCQHPEFLRTLTKLKSVLDFMQINSVELHFLRNNNSKNRISKKPLIISCSNIPENRMIENSFLPIMNDIVSDCSLTDKNESDNSSFKEKNFSLFKGFSDNSKNSEDFLNYLSICECDKDNNHECQEYNRSVYDVLKLFSQYNTLPSVTIPIMKRNGDVDYDVERKFMCGLCIDIGHDIPHKPNFRTGLRITKIESARDVQECLKTDGIIGKAEINCDVKDSSFHTHDYFQQAAKNLTELQEHIQKAKATRQSASSELEQLQYILLGPSPPSFIGNSECHDIIDESDKIGDTEKISTESAIKAESTPIHGEQVGQASVVEPNVTVTDQSVRRKKHNLQRLRKNLLRVEQRHFEDIARIEKELQITRNKSVEVRQNCEDKVDILQITISQLQKDMKNFQKALAELQKQARAKGESTSSNIEKEIRSRIQHEVEQEWKEKFHKMENKLHVAEKQIRSLHEENDELHHRLLLYSQSQSNSNHPHNLDESMKSSSSSVLNGFIPHSHFNCQQIAEKKLINDKRLRDELRESEERVDHLNILLDEKLVELNKLQLSFSKRTKEMVLLERAYLQLVCHLYKNQNHPIRTINHLSSLLEETKAMDDPP